MSKVVKSPEKSRWLRFLVGMPVSLILLLGLGMAKGTLTGDKYCAGCQDMKDVGEFRQSEKADNSFCIVCHFNFEEEELVDVHKTANIGCVNCHGDSDEHADDEDHVIPPEIMFAKSDINKSCQTGKCHPWKEIETDHQPFFSGTDTEDKYCIDCHGKHMIQERQRKWDKKTRKLIFRDGYETGGGGL